MLFLERLPGKEVAVPAMLVSGEVVWYRETVRRRVMVLEELREMPMKRKLRDLVISIIE